MYRALSSLVDSEPPLLRRVSDFFEFVHMRDSKYNEVDILAKMSLMLRQDSIMWINAGAFSTDTWPSCR